MGQVRQRLHASCSTWVEATRACLTRASLFGSIVKKSAHVLVVPVVLFCLMTTLGIWGVKTAVSRTQEIERNTAAVDADSASQALQLAIQRATLPVTQMAEIVQDIPQWSLLEKQWQISAPAAWLGAARGSLFMFAVPLGILRLLHPENLAPPFTASLIKGANVFLPPLRDLALIALGMNQTSSIQGPALANGNYLMCLVVHPVHINNMARNDTWDYKFNERVCPPGFCYNNETRTRLWGAVVLVLDAAYLFGPDGPLSPLVRKGYRFQLWHPPVPVGVSSVLESFSGDNRLYKGELIASPRKEMVRGLVPMSGLSSNQTEPPDAVVVAQPLVNQMWELHVWKDSWAPSWMLPLIAVVVLGALLVSVLVFTTLWSWAENRALLHSLLPKETIERMRQEGVWATDNEDDAIKTVRLETPAELMLRIVEDCIAGRHPDLPMLLSVRDALHRSADVYRPNEQQIRSRMSQLANMDDEVRRALAAQLMGNINDMPEGRKPSELLTTKLSLNSASLEDDSSESGVNKALIKSVTLGQNEFKQENLPAQASGNPGFNHTGALSSVRLNPLYESQVDSVLAGWLIQTPTVITLVQEAGKQSAPATIEARLIHPADPVTDNQADNAVVAPVAVVVRPILTKLEQVLHTANDWSFDAFELEEASHGRPLSCLGFWLLHSNGVKTRARIKTSRLICFLERVEAGYADNPYHNKRHAADVLQSVHVIMHRSGLMPGFADQLTLFGCYLAAIVHDFEHVGRNNDFLVNSSDDLAVRYNDRSPMENHHLAAAWSLLKTKECNILSGLSSSDVAKLRKLVIDLVLGTDMKQHFAIQGQFETMARQAHELACSDHSSPSRHAASIEWAADDGHGLPETGLTPVNDQDQLLSLQMMLKCADLGHIAAPLPVHLKWVSALEAEFFLQGDAEKAMGLPISPLCDRTKEGVTKSQIGFFDFVVLPGSKAFCNRFTGARPLLAAIASNNAYWKSLAAGSST